MNSGILVIVIVNLYFIFKERIKKTFWKFKDTYNIRKQKITGLDYNKIILIVGESVLLLVISYYLKKYIGINFSPIEQGNEVEINLSKFAINLKPYEKNYNEFIEGIENIFNYSKSLEIYLGLIGLISAVYIYCIGIADSFKKNILIFLMGDGDILFISVSILLFYFFNIPSILFISLTLILFFKLLIIINYIFIFLDQKRFEEIFSQKIVEKFKENGNERALSNLYEEIKFNLYEAVLSKNLFRSNELMFYFISFLKIDKNNADKKSDPESEFISFFYKIYKYLIETPDTNTLLLVSTMSKCLGNYFLEKRNYRYAKACYSLTEYDYEYYIKNYKEDIFLNIGFRLFSSLGSYRSNDVYKLACIEHGLLKVIYNCIKLDDYKNLKEFLVFYDFGLESNELRRRVKIYSSMIIIYFLNGVKDTKIEVLEHRDKILNDLISKIECEGIKPLEEAYTLGKEKGLYNFLEVERFDFSRYDFSGMAGGIFSSEQVSDIFIRIFNNHWEDLSENFILKNWRELENLSAYEKLENIIQQLKKYEVKIELDRVKTNYDKKLDYKKISENIDKINENEKKTKIFNILKDISTNPIQSMTSSVPHSRRSTKIKAQNSLISSDFFVDKVCDILNQINESLFIENIIDKKIPYLNEIENLENYIIIVSLESFVKLRRDKKIIQIEKDVYIFKNSKVYFLPNKYEIKLPILIKLNSIFQVFYNKQKDSKLEYSQLLIRQLEENEIDEINGLSEEEKKIKARGMSEIEIFKDIELIYNDEFEVLEVENLFDNY